MFAVLDWWIVGEALVTVPVNMQTQTGLTLLQLVCVSCASVSCVQVLKCAPPDLGLLGERPAISPPPCFRGAGGVEWARRHCQHAAAGLVRAAALLVMVLGRGQGANGRRAGWAGVALALWLFTPLFLPAPPPTPHRTHAGPTPCRTS